MKKSIAGIACLFISVLMGVYGQKKVSGEWTALNQSIELNGNKEVRITAFLKVNNIKSALSVLWLRSIKENDKKGEYVNTQNIYEGSKEWKKVVLKKELKDDEVKLLFGVVSYGEGDFYYDSFKVELKNSEGKWEEIQIANANFDTIINKKQVSGWSEGSDREIRDVREFTFESSTDTPDNSNYSLLIKGRQVFGSDNDDSFVKIMSDSENTKGQEVLIEDVQYVDVLGGKLRSSDILIKNGKIEKIANNIKKNEEYYVINGKNKWLTPGFVDAHIHLFQSGGLYTRPDVLDLTEFRSYQKERKWLKRNAPDILKRYIKSGVTTVIDVGGPMYNFQIRDEFQKKEGFPNVFLTGPLISTYQPSVYSNIDDAPILKAKTKEEAVQMVRDQLKYKPDFIKIWYIARSKEMAEKNFDLVKATIEESHKNGLKVAVHATQLNTAKLALKAKADILVHSVDDEVVDEEFIEMLLKNKVIYVPTLIVSANYVKTFKGEIDLTEEDFEIANPFTIGWLQDVLHLNKKHKRLKRIKERYSTEERIKSGIEEDKIMKKNLKILSGRGVLIATGTDAGNIGTLHGSSYYDELKEMKDAGMSEIEILKASTINGAKVLGKEDQIGSISVGKKADLVILNSNPLSDINALKDIKYIIKEGIVYKKENVLEETPEALVQQQLNAYNDGDIEAFLAPYGEDVEIYTFPNDLTTKGKKDMRPTYSKMFEKYPNLHCELVNRIVNGNTVIDHEKITGVGAKEFKAIAIYKINNGKIAKVYFAR